jgi:RNA polymerase sigma-70 factor (ECF subfamily)
VVQNDSEAEDVVQQAYVNAFDSLGKFRGDSSLATWLTRIVLNEALGRLRRQRPMVELEVLDTEPSGASKIIPFPLMPATSDPERDAAQRQIRQLIERAIDDLPEIFRVVFVMRDVEDMSIEETAGFLGLPPATVKTRLHRAKAIVRRELFARAGGSTADAFTFGLSRCDAIVKRVLAQLDAST